MNEFTYDMIYLVESVTNILFKAALLILINKYLEIRRIKQ